MRKNFHKALLVLKTLFANFNDTAILHVSNTLHFDNFVIRMQRFIIEVDNINYSDSVDNISGNKNVNL